MTQPTCPDCGRPMVFWQSDRGHFCPCEYQREGNNGTIEQEQEARVPDMQRG